MSAEPALTWAKRVPIITLIIDSRDSITAAGISLDKPFLDQTPEDIRRLNQINVEGTFMAAQCATRHMIQQGKGGSIVMVGSVCATVPTPGHRLSFYCGTKGAVNQMSKALSVELAPHGIRCNTVSPG
jgi:sorbose reductase